MQLVGRTLLLFITLIWCADRALSDPSEINTPASFTFPGYLPADCDNLFVLGDVMPSLRRILNSGAYRKFAADSEAAKFMRAQGNEMNDVLPQLEAKAPFFQVR
jgi:hypothetical protein